ncbi:MAG: DUF3429 domain-containing protein [Gammaproteobacteria bacterium]|nr:MAG: DUF3429 domain-containing protein [Gammaproteobacteria bacterium]
MGMIRGLGYAGLIPFIALAWLAWQPVIGSSAQALQLFHIYSALILGFMAGVLWPVLYPTSTTNRMALLAVSFPVASFLAFAFLPTLVAPIQALLFVALRLAEIVGGTDREYPPGYSSLRWQLTAAVVACHVWITLLA